MPTRRNFLKGLTGGILAGTVALPILQACTPTSVPLPPDNTGATIDANGRVTVDVSDLTANNPAKVAPGVTGPDNFPVMITFVSAGTYTALSMKCTHQGCQVDSQLSSGDIHCSCHGSMFHLDGSLDNGKTLTVTSALPTYPLDYDASSNSVKVKVR